MLSYRHSFHAGNFADVLKHIVLIEVLQHLGKKDKAFDYIDTHSGAGLYHLASVHAEKLQEYQNGIAKLDAADWPELSAYFSVINSVNTDKSLLYYPGSPFIALHFMRRQDRAWLYELHPEDAGLLLQNTQNIKRARVMREDGLKGLLSLLPPVSRRGLVLIDPSYEIKSDYDLVFQTVEKAYAKFPTGTYAVWYPVVERSRITRLEKQFIKSGIKNIQRFELAVTADSDERGMTSSGMIVINPPWQLMDTMSQLLPKLVNRLAIDSGAFYKSEVLVAE
ncbi:23S rRNA (adenine(2030)-N(6))-methyltransferase RlmJ [Methylophaga pinxianii]|uniref:23S rRNA (adenine(2030)-N(6))-methyltransferase RlmJ n=1 Tax=Methylophaga pinxianii TaxID=2881052 RepID=UPI001CF4B059|nr:23S rRNA (adenine(2030)-N(6))-methyltransferase RlmJ [Methylophaga pinxianii]MCB2427607.1 23S rRNA (adenine(2030)-N(6))-methyltransferase RlmJ [Methylophaga pinxianii]UPH46598.1 23S rRNA (adenine(2030)-N(6))-methyltransferase RlmJ [Methylophaga pinxianii]